MPHRVVDFFRSSNDSINNIKASVQRRSSPHNAHTRSTSRERPARNSSYASSIDDGTTADHVPAQHSTAPTVKMPESAKEKEKHNKDHHRLSFPIHLGGSKSHKDQSQHPNASLGWKIESPPAVMYGDTENSTGALVSGQLLLSVKEEAFEVESFEARLEIHVVQKRPFNGHCHNCAHQTTELKKWSLLNEPTTLTKRTHEFPFSVLLEGHLPATTDNSVVSVRYDFIAEAKPKNGPVLKLNKNIDVKRSLPVPELPHHSIRIFPPTNITASVHFDQVVHPMAANTFSVRLDGIVKHNTEAKSTEYWKLKRLSWKLEEKLTTIAPACDKHAPKEPETSQPAKKGLPRTDERVLAHADMHGGWKSDYSPSGQIDMEIEYQCPASAKANCDMKSRDGTEITHQLVVEMVVVQEYAPTSQPKHVTPTGVARILRMHFGVVLTERAGLGVSWDNEAPPIYQDVPPSPPEYVSPPSPPAYISNDMSLGSTENLSMNRQSGEEQGEVIRGRSPTYELSCPRAEPGLQ